MKTRSFLLAAGLVLAMAFTYSCSSGDDDNGGGSPSSNGGTQGGINLSDLPKQVYLVKMENHGEIVSREEYLGNGNVFVRFWRDEYDLLPAGNIQNGKLSLNLPPSIDSKYYLNRLWDCYEAKGEDCQLSVAPQNLAYAYAESFFVAIPGENNCSIKSWQTGSEGMYREGAALVIYSPEPGTVTGPREGEIFNLNFSKGWNNIFVYRYSNDADDIEYWTNNLPAGITLEWWLQCR